MGSDKPRPYTILLVVQALFQIRYTMLKALIFIDASVDYLWVPVDLLLVSDDGCTIRSLIASDISCAVWAKLPMPCVRVVNTRALPLFLYSDFVERYAYH